MLASFLALTLALVLGPAPLTERAFSLRAPRIFFTDLESGPNRGGEADGGVFLTIRGARFGATRGSSTVTVGGGRVRSYRSWGASRIVVQIGPRARRGRVVVHTRSGASNGVRFTVRGGRILFVAPGGDDRASGSFRTPWRTVTHAVDAMRAGDVVYLRDGVRQTAEDEFDAALSIERSGRLGAPKALVAYPGARAVIGSTALEFGARVPNLGQATTDWVLAGLVLRGRVQALDIGGRGARRWRVVGNDVSCPVAEYGGCFAASLASYVRFVGNDVHHIGARATGEVSKLFSAVYFTTDTNHVEVAYNRIHDNRSCRALQFHSSPLDGGTGRNQYDLSVHHNLIRGAACDGINLATVDPSKGRVRVYANVVTAVGRGPMPAEGDANYACIHVAGITNAGTPGRGTVEVFQNTLYDCGARGGGDAGAISVGSGATGLVVRLIDNIVALRRGETYLSPATDPSRLRGSHNLWWGGSDRPPRLAGNVVASPRFVDAAHGDFRLLATSPAIDRGVTGIVTTDRAGVLRPQGRAPDLGAYERPA